MQQTLMHLEHARTVADERTGEPARAVPPLRVEARHGERDTSAADAWRRRLAGVLARAAERLDAEALSPHWRRP